MSDGKRDPYRQKASVRDPVSRPRGPMVRRADEPDEDDVAPSTPRDPTQRPTPDPDAGVFSGLVSPHPASTTGEAWAQRALTLIGLPLIVSTFVLVGWVDSRRAWGEVVQHGRNAPRPVGIAHPIAWIFGALPIGLACFAGETHWAFATATIGVPFAALFARRSLRARIVEREAMLARRRRKR